MVDKKEETGAAGRMRSWTRKAWNYLAPENPEGVTVIPTPMGTIYIYKNGDSVPEIREYDRDF